MQRQVRALCVCEGEGGARDAEAFLSGGVTLGGGGEGGGAIDKDGLQRVYALLAHVCQV
jgi:hypothetical protein